MNVRRPHTDELGDVLALMRAHDEAAWGNSDWTEDDLRDHWAKLELDRDAWVVELDSSVAGYVDFERRPGGRMVADGYVHPDFRARGVGSALAAAVERRAAEEAATIEGRAYLHYGALLADGAAARLFERRGYRSVRHQWRMVVDLEVAPAAEPPAEIVIGPYQHPDDARAVHAALEEAFQDHWENQPRPFEEWARRQFERPGFDPALWVVARDGDQIVAASLNDWKRHGDWGWVGVLGVRRAWRRRGVANALLKRSFAEFFRRGERRVALQVDAQSPTGATRLYERAGMRVLYEVAVYEKEFDAG